MKKKLFTIAALSLSLALSPLGMIQASAAVTTKGVQPAIVMEKGSTGLYSEEDGKYPTYYVTNVQMYTFMNDGYEGTFGVDYDCIEWVNKGEPVQVIENMLNGYYRCIYNGEEGYISANRLCRVKSEDLNDGDHDILLFTNGYLVDQHDIFTSPDSNSKVLATVDSGSILEATGKIKDGFFEVSYNGSIGYIFATQVYSPWNAPLIGTPCTAVNCKSGLDLRPYPTSDGEEIITMQMGDTMYYLGEIRNDYLLVSYNGYIGWVHCNWVQKSNTADTSGLGSTGSGSTGSESTGYGSSNSSGSDSESSSSGSECDGSASEESDNWSPLKEGTPLMVVNCKGYITLRAEANAYADELDKIFLGLTCIFKKDMGNGFYQVEYNGKTGYVMNGYLTVTSGKLEVVNCNQAVCMLEEPKEGAKIIIDVNKGEIVTFVSNANKDYYKVSYNGIEGYLPKDCLLWQ